LKGGTFRPGTRSRKAACGKRRTVRAHCEMKTILSYIIFALMMTSCNQEKEHLSFAQEKADKFIENYTNAFLNDKDLLKYSYHPRAQFSNATDSFNIYSVFLREDELRIHCFSDSCMLTEAFNYAPLILSKGSYRLKQDSIVEEISYDSIKLKLHRFKSDPPEYFSELKNRIERYGIFAYVQKADQSFTKVYLTNEYYLLHTEEIEKEINQDRIVKSYNDNWYLVKMERPMDLG
jgi:hypothetical protein